MTVWPLLAAVAATTADAGAEDFTRGRDAYRAGRMDEALELLDRAVGAAPEHAGAHLYRALARDELGDAAGARADFDRALALAPADWDDASLARVQYAALLLRAGETGPAERQVRAALARDARDWQAHQVLGDVLARAGRVAEAAEAYRTSAALGRESGAWHSLGDLHLSRGERAQAAEAYRKDLERNPACHEARINVAAVALADGDAPTAVRQYRASLTYHPDDPVALRGLARAYRARGDLEQAIGAWRHLLEVAPGDAEADRELGRARRIVVALPCAAVAGVALLAGFLAGFLAGRRRRRGRPEAPPPP